MASNVPESAGVRPSQILREGRRHLINSGPVYIASLPGAEALGTQGRTDTNGDVIGSLRSIQMECGRLGPIDTIPLNDEASIQVGSTFGGSPHTHIVAPYELSAKLWREALREGLGADHHPQDGPIVAGVNDLTPTHLPAHLMTWVMAQMTDTKNPQENLPLPVSPFDIAYPEGQGLGRIRLPDGGAIPVSEAQLRDMYSAIERRLALHRRYLEALGTTHVVPALQEKLEQMGFKHVNVQSLLENVETMIVGHSRDMKRALGIGGGPQSHPTLHLHNVLYLNIQKVRELFLSGGQLSEQVITNRFNELFRGNPALMGSYAPGQATRELLFKQIDPYSQIFFSHMHQWVTNKLGQAFSQAGYQSPNITSFSQRKSMEYHVSSFTQGWDINCACNFVDASLALNRFLHTMGSLWQDAHGAWKQYNDGGGVEGLATLQTRYGLPPEVVTDIQQIVPTRTQRENWNQVGKPAVHGRALNIPGVPPFGIRFYRDENGALSRIQVVPLLSEKSFAEVLYGGPVQRQRGM